MLFVWPKVVGEGVPLAWALDYGWRGMRKAVDLKTKIRTPKIPKSEGTPTNVPPRAAKDAPIIVPPTFQSYSHTLESSLLTLTASYSP